MAGSYKHVVDEKGRLRDNESFVNQIENLGDAYEAVEEMYGMIWWLALSVSGYEELPVARRIELARQNYKNGLRLSTSEERKYGTDA